jgi:hypothetical protein
VARVVQQMVLVGAVALHLLASGKRQELTAIILHKLRALLEAKLPGQVVLQGLPLFKEVLFYLAWGYGVQ